MYLYLRKSLTGLAQWQVKSWIYQQMDIPTNTHLILLSFLLTANDISVNYDVNYDSTLWCCIYRDIAGPNIIHIFGSQLPTSKTARDRYVPSTHRAQISLFVYHILHEYQFHDVLALCLQQLLSSCIQAYTQILHWVFANKFR